MVNMHYYDIIPNVSGIESLVAFLFLVFLIVDIMIFGSWWEKRMHKE